MSAQPTALYDYRKYWAECFGPAPWLPMSQDEMAALGWDSCDIIIISGDGYVDHPSFGMAVIGRVLEAQGFRVGMIAQPDWRSAEPFKALGRPNLFFGVTAGNMDSIEVTWDVSQPAGLSSFSSRSQSAWAYSQPSTQSFM